jgi:hypothetical protein
VYQDVRSQYGLVVDMIDRIQPHRIGKVRMGHQADVLDLDPFSATGRSLQRS